MSSEPAISVQHLSKEFRLGLRGRTSSMKTIVKEKLAHPVRSMRAPRERFIALDDVTFDVAPGEVVGVIGRNGAGKSTLLKILSRITLPSSGTIDIAGSVGSLLEVGTGFHQELTGIENVYLNGAILGMTKQQIDDRLEEIVEFADVRKFLDTPVKRYSSGMRVRPAFAVAAHLEPEILIIDEVLSVGDAGFQTKCLDKMRAISSEDGRTVLFVSHNLVSVEHLCSRAMLLTDGRVTFDGAARDAVARYLEALPHAEAGDEVGVFDLAAADRSGTNYDAMLRRMVLRPEAAIPSRAVRMGDRLRMEIDVQGLDDAPDAIVIVTVGSNLSDCVFRMNSSLLPLQAGHERRTDETIVLDLPALPLTPGEYHVDLHIKDKDQRGTIDLVRRAAEFTVVPADVHGSGAHYSQDDGYVMVPWTWELRPTSPAATVQGDVRTAS